jgi:hypothetical protein
MDPKRLKQREQTGEQQTARQEQTHREFASVDDLLRQDREQVTPPPAIAERLKDSLKKEPPPPERQPWWRRLFRS